MRIGVLFVIVVLLCPGQVFSWALSSGIEVVTSHGEGLTLRYVSGEIEREARSIEGKEYDLLSVPGCEWAGAPGEPQVPVRTVVVGIPPQARVVATVMTDEVVQRGGYRIVPVPSYVPQEGGIGYRVEYKPKREVYAQDRLYPPLAVEVEEPTWMRHQRVVRLSFFPLQFNPATGGLRHHSVIQVSLAFVPTTSDDQIRRARETDLWENVYRSVLINYDEARAWRGCPLVSVAPHVAEVPFSRSDEWYRIEVAEEGLYQLDYGDLQRAGLDLAGVDPRTIRVFNGGGEMLPHPPDTVPSLREMAIYVHGEEDGSFDQSDYVLFYGWATSEWKYGGGSWSYYTNDFTDVNVYWLTPEGTFSDPARRMQTIDGSPTGVEPQKKFPDRAHQERDVRFEKYWYWDSITSGHFSLDLRGVATGESATVTVARTAPQVIRVNGVVAPSGRTENLVEGRNDLFFDFGGYETKVDWYEVAYWRVYEAYDDYLRFEGPEQVGVVGYEIAGLSGADPWVLDITDRFQVRRIVGYQRADDRLLFEAEASTDDRELYLVAGPGTLRHPSGVSRRQRADLRDEARRADYLVIVDEEFYEEALLLEAHREERGLATEVIDVADIYDEFSWGLLDPRAIRHFLRYAFYHWTPPAPAYVLLMGDGNFDYKNNSGAASKNWIPPYYKPNLNGIDQADASDDYFVYVENDFEASMAIGRMPVRSSAQARATVDKVVAYEENPLLGPWRNTFVAVADDEFEAMTSQDPLWSYHIHDTEELVGQLPLNFDVRKVYLTDYKFDSSYEKPGAHQAVINSFNEGCLFVNFTGHGNRVLWTHQNVLNGSTDIPLLNNQQMLPLVYSASCNVGHYDHHLNECLSEKLLRMSGGGAIATISATRESSASPNAILNQRFSRWLLKNSLSIGQALYAAKAQNSKSDGANDRLYLLFGDPAMMIGAPRLQVKIASVRPESLQALNVTTVSGYVADSTGGIETNFDGLVYLSAFDSKHRHVHETPFEDGNGNPRTIPYYRMGAMIFRGTATVEAGRFNASFFVPKGVSYGENLARISAYVYNDVLDGAGARDSIPVGGTGQVVVDTTGPTIQLNFIGQQFGDGDWVTPHPTLRAEISDTNGVNITGEMGHTISLQIDHSQTNQVDITHLFEYHLDSYREGSLEYTLHDIEPGEHTVALKAWDNYNNSSTGSVRFVVASESELKITDVMNYPNPFNKETAFYYQLTQPAQVTIKIFTQAGRLIKTIRHASGETGFNEQPWDGRDQDGDRIANGVYLYKIIAKTSKLNGEQQTESYGKAVVMR